MKKKRITLDEKTINSTLVFSGNLLQVFKDEVQLPDGKKSTREWIQHPGACAVLPVYENGDVLLLNQFRYPLKKDFIEVPAGKIDSGEPPLTTAKRELEEETGLRGKKWVSLGTYHPCIGYADEIIYLYLTLELTQKEIQVDPDEFVLPLRMPFHKALEKVSDGIITDGKTIVNLLKAQKWWIENAPFHISF